MAIRAREPSLADSWQQTWNIKKILLDIDSGSRLFHVFIVAVSG